MLLDADQTQRDIDYMGPPDGTAIKAAANVSLTQKKKQWVSVERKRVVGRRNFSVRGRLGIGYPPLVKTTWPPLK
jgi:hypothetical protein